jgi:ribonuclease E
MTSKILINAVDPEVCRIAKVIDSKLAEFQIDNASREITRGNIYKASVVRVEPSLQAVFIDYGAERHGFLQQHEIHSDYFQDTPSGDRSIRTLVKRGQELLVQVNKDPFMKKGAMLTTYISIPGRYLVLMPGSDTRGISRKIEEESERKRLKDILTGLKIPEGYGVIVRTVGVGCTKAMLQKDLSYLLRLWKTINAKVQKIEAPALLHKERRLAIRSIRDYLTPDVNEILIDNESVYNEVRDFIAIISPKQKGIVRHHRGQKPIFTKHQLETQIASIFKNRVSLKSGGSIVIAPTEALVAIDVNSGKSTSKKSIEDTAHATNIEAAEEIARQLRLRDLGGLIVIDFIDMRDRKHKVAVEKALKQHVKADKARTKIGRISRFGLLEMSRQRIMPSIEYGSYVTCRHCKGKGQVPSTETLGLDTLRKLKIEAMKTGVKKLTACLPASVADYLLNNKRRELLNIEDKFDLVLEIVGDAEKVPGDAGIEAEMDRAPD